MFDIGSQYGFEMTVLDVGGGFPGTDDAKITIHEVSYTKEQQLLLGYT